MRFLPIEKQTLYIIMAFLLLIIAITTGVIYPSTREIKKSETEIQTLHTYLERRYRRVAAVRTALNEVRVIRGAVSEYEQRLFKRGEELGLITDLEALASNRRVAQKITHSNFDAPGGPTVQLGLTASGNYAAVLQYLADLERLPYFLTVTESRLTPLADRSTPETVRQAALDLELVLYVN